MRIRLAVEGFKPFGDALVKPSGAPTSTGEGFECWFDIGVLQDTDHRLGQVLATKPEGGITHMECHHHRELLLPIHSAVVQAVAPRSRLDAVSARPDGADVRAFVIDSGEAVLIEKGVWHATAVPVADSAFYYFTGLVDEPGSGAGEWLPFLRNECFELDLD